MLTLKLWHALHNPPSTHPLFRRMVVLPSEAYRKRRSLSWANLIIVLVIGLGEQIPTLLLFLMPVLLFFTGIIYGLDCALQVSYAIAHAHESDTFHLLSLAPPGPLGTSWTLCTSSLYRNREFDQLHVIVRASLWTGMIVTLVVGSLVILGQSVGLARNVAPALPILVTVVDLGGIFAAIYAEYIQSALVGCLVGMAVPTYVRSGLDAGLYAFAAFMLFQISCYFLTILIGFYLIPSLYQMLGFDGEYAEISLTILRVAVFIGIREGLIRLIWRHLLERLNAHPPELDYVMHPL